MRKIDVVARSSLKKQSTTINDASGSTTNFAIFTMLPSTNWEHDRENQKKRVQPNSPVCKIPAAPNPALVLHSCLPPGKDPSRHELPLHSTTARPIRSLPFSHFSSPGQEEMLSSQSHHGTVQQHQLAGVGWNLEGAWPRGWAGGAMGTATWRGTVPWPPTGRRVR